jgi:hypothetical protein
MARNKMSSASLIMSTWLSSKSMNPKKLRPEYQNHLYACSTMVSALQNRRVWHQNHKVLGRLFGAGLLQGQRQGWHEGGGGFHGHHRMIDSFLASSSISPSSSNSHCPTMECLAMTPTPPDRSGHSMQTTRDRDLSTNYLQHLQ